MCKWLAEQGLGEIQKIITKTDKGLEIVESHYRQCHEETHHTEEEEEEEEDRAYVNICQRSDQESKKRQEKEIVEIHEHSRPKWTRRIEEKACLNVWQNRD